MPNDMMTAQGAFDTITLLTGPPLLVTYESIPIDCLELDRDNPRLRYQLVLHPQKNLEEMLFEEDDTKWLYGDIRINGLLDRPYVRKVGDKYIVKEGNRRGACCLRLHREMPEDPRWQMIPVRVLPGNTTEAQISLLMASCHVAGKVKWHAHEKAGHIYEMSRKLMIPMDTMKAILHMGEPAITKTIEAYSMMMERYATIDSGKYAAKAEGKWSFFAELGKISQLNKRAKDDTVFADDFCRWVGEERLPRAECVRKLPEILKRDHSRNLFLDSPPAAAYRLGLEASEAAEPAAKSKFYKVVKDFIKLGHNANMDDVLLASTNATAKQQLHEARDVLNTIVAQAQAMQSRT